MTTKRRLGNFNAKATKERTNELREIVAKRFALVAGALLLAVSGTALAQRMISSSSHLPSLRTS